MFPPPMLQYEPEFNAFLDLIREMDVRSYLEVGCKFGGTFWRVGKAMPRKSLCVSIDLPRTTETTSWRSMNAVLRRLDTEGKKVHAIWGDSTSLKTIEQAQNFAPFDAVFIDCNHSLRYVTSDWRNYGPMARKFVAFHDIAHVACDVPTFWADLKGQHPHREIKLDPSGTHNGIGVILI